MLRKIILLIAIAAAVYFFYQKFVASTVEPFFKDKSGNVDIYQLNIRDSQKAESLLKEEGL
ncbi:MAG: hypothetical protein PHR84_02450 [Candidatus Omnitrophica bacterium]|jgi:hypothetical protein|nr:hypothetical protein [Candidatus Omnitrophota bacterium]MDD5660539.1 hypothetical protein [Candidatus Omnitrophota bacterium]